MTDLQPQSGRKPPRHLSQRAHRILIGVLGLFLPLLLYIVAGLRPVPELPHWAVLGSVSAYYYTGAVGIFVGVLFALSLFLFTYPGYEGERVDRVVGKIGGAAAMGVALFPAGAPGGIAEPSWWNDSMGRMHYASAIVLFVTFILFATWLFRKSGERNRKERSRDKRWRDDVCLACGLVMIVALILAVVQMQRKQAIFVPEAIAILAFAVSWLAKGEVHRSVAGVYRRWTAGSAGS